MVRVGTVWSKTSGVSGCGDQNHGPDWITFYGEIPISNQVRVSGFRTAGLLVRVSLRAPRDTIVVG